MSDRITRYASLVSQRDLSSSHPLVVGVGAIGYALARLLAQTGVNRLTLVDPDSISELNLGPQGWPSASVGASKVLTAEAAIAALNPECACSTVHDYFDDPILLGAHPPITHIFACVDSSEGRSSILSAARTHRRPLVDARMNSLQARILTVLPTAKGTSLSYDDYERTLSQISSAEESCTNRASSWCASAASAFLLSQFIGILRGQPVHGDYTVSMGSCMITKANDPSELLP